MGILSLFSQLRCFFSCCFKCSLALVCFDFLTFCFYICLYNRLRFSLIMMPVLETLLPVRIQLNSQCRLFRMLSSTFHLWCLSTLLGCLQCSRYVLVLPLKLWYNFYVLVFKKLILAYLITAATHCFRIMGHLYSVKSYRLRSRKRWITFNWSCCCV